MSKPDLIWAEEYPTEEPIFCHEEDPKTDWLCTRPFDHAGDLHICRITATSQEEGYLEVARWKSGGNIIRDSS